MKASCKNEIACYQHYGNGSQNIREENVYINIISVSISSENIALKFATNANVL